MSSSLSCTNELSDFRFDARDALPFTVLCASFFWWAKDFSTQINVSLKAFLRFRAASLEVIVSALFAQETSSSSLQ